MNYFSAEKTITSTRSPTSAKPVHTTKATTTTTTTIQPPTLAPDSSPEGEGEEEEEEEEQDEEDENQHGKPETSLVISASKRDSGCLRNVQ